MNTVEDLTKMKDEESNSLLNDFRQLPEWSTLEKEVSGQIVERS